jgi:tetratricopeptide (TPR) repeat protein
MEERNRVESHPVDYLTMVLNYISRLVQAANMPEAEAQAERAAQFARERFAREPDRFRIGLANCLETLAMIRSDRGRHAESRDLREEAISLLKEASGQQRTLAQCHSNLAGVLRSLGDLDGALRNSQEAVTLYRSLVPIEREARVDYSSGLEAFAGDPRPSLGDALVGLSTYQNDAKLTEECLASSQEAADIFSELAGDFPDSFSDHLGMARHNLGMAKFGVGDGPGGLREMEASAAIFETLAKVRPEVYEPTLAHTLSSVVRANLKLHRFSEALSRARRLVDLSRRLQARSPSKFLNQHLFNLELLVSMLREAGQTEEAGPVLEEIARLKPGATSQESDFA